MNKISWAEIQHLLPKEAKTHEQEFKQLFKRFGAEELSVNDIDLVLNEKSLDTVTVADVLKIASFDRYFYDSLGQIIGRIETDDNGDSRAYDKSGNYVGQTSAGMTLNAAGELVAQSDVLSSLFVREERIVGSVCVEDLIKEDLMAPVSITVAHVIEGIGIDYLELEDEPTQEYVPVSKGRGKFKVYDIVMTPFGRGRIITKQTEDKPYTYGVKITSTDELEIVDEDDLKMIKEEVVMNELQTQQGYSLDNVVGVKDLIRLSMEKSALDIEWIRAKWDDESKKVMDQLAKESQDFADDLEAGHIPLLEEYSLHDLKRVTSPYMQGSIDQDQAEKLLRDLMYQFRAKLYSDYGLTVDQARKDKEKEEAKEKESRFEKDLPAYGVADIYPYSGTGAGMPSSGDLTRIINDAPSRQIRLK
jgi:hypothetical protein